VTRKKLFQAFQPFQSFQWLDRFKVPGSRLNVTQDVPIVPVVPSLRSVQIVGVDLLKQLRYRTA
jgi:hypothetical protein